MTWERRCREQQHEARPGVWNLSYGSVDEDVCAADERLLDQANPWVVKDPHAVVAVGGDNVDGVHDALGYS